MLTGSGSAMRFGGTLVATARNVGNVGGSARVQAEVQRALGFPVDVQSVIGCSPFVLHPSPKP